MEKSIIDMMRKIAFLAWKMHEDYHSVPYQYRRNNLSVLINAASAVSLVLSSISVLLFMLLVFN